MMYDLLQTGEGDGGVLVIKHRHLEAALRVRWLGAEIHCSKLLTLMLETRGGGQVDKFLQVQRGSIARLGH